jgi:hypothetical protein
MRWARCIPQFPSAVCKMAETPEHKKARRLAKQREYHRQYYTDLRLDPMKLERQRATAKRSYDKRRRLWAGG